MRVIRDSLGYLRLDGDALRGAEEAFRQRRYVEAFALLHALVDWWMIDLYQLNEYPSVASHLERVRNLFEREDYRFKPSLKYLLDKTIISPKEYEGLIAFNKLRDKIIHRLVMYSFQHFEKNRIGQKEVDEGFREGVELVGLLRSQSEAIIRRQSTRSGQSN
jgi:hypothetical protein